MGIKRWVASWESRNSRLPLVIYWADTQQLLTHMGEQNSSF